jgi:hypothetical protein
MLASDRAAYVTPAGPSFFPPCTFEGSANFSPMTSLPLFIAFVEPSPFFYGQMQGQTAQVDRIMWPACGIVRTRIRVCGEILRILRAPQASVEDGSVLRIVRCLEARFYRIEVVFEFVHYLIVDFIFISQVENRCALHRANLPGEIPEPFAIFGAVSRLLRCAVGRQIQPVTLEMDQFIVHG